MKPKLSILIPTLVGREEKFDALLKSLMSQHDGTQVEIVVEKDNREKSIGEKRNNLLQTAIGEYTAFVDDDDRVSQNYISLLLRAIDSGCDCASLKGEITFDGKDPHIYEHSLKYNAWKTNEGVAYGQVKYERFPNHLNCIKASIAKQFKFPEKNHGEDFDWSTLLHQSGLIKTEYYIDEVIYFYDYITNKK